MNIISIDEMGSYLSPGYGRLLDEHRYLMTPNGLWNIYERFNDRYSTAVGGNLWLVTQTLADMEATPGQPLPGQSEMVTRDPVIIDYENNPRGLHISMEEAEGQPALIEVLSRLKERIAKYEAMTAKGNA